MRPIAPDDPRRRLLARIREPLQQAYGDRLRGVVLYGSEARGEAQPDSDIDVLVLLEGPVEFWEELKTCIHALYPLVLDLDGRPIDVFPVDAEEYRSSGVAALADAREQGVVG